MIMRMRSATRAGAALAVAVVGWQRWDLDATAVRPVLFIVLLSACGAELDRARLGRSVAERVWAQAAAWVTVATVMIGVLHAWPLFVILPVAAIAGASVAVPAWTIVAGTRLPESDDGPPQISRAVMTLVTVTGVAALLAVPIAALVWEATIQWSGCFLVCSAPNHVAAVGSVTAAAALLIDVVVWGIAAWRRFPRMVTGTAAVPLLACALAVCLMP